MWAKEESEPHFSAMIVELASATGGRIVITYPELRSYRLSMNSDTSGNHGEWEYDEFTLAEDGSVVHTIEWSDGAVWKITSSDVFHEYVPET